MTFATLPLKGTTGDKFTIRTDLLGIEYRFDFQWNVRDAHWYFSMFTSSGEPILQGMKITIGNLILDNDRSQLRPRGVLIPVDKEGTDKDPGLTDLGNRVDIVFTDFQ